MHLHRSSAGLLRGMRWSTKVGPLATALLGHPLTLAHSCYLLLFQFSQGMGQDTVTGVDTNSEARARVGGPPEMRNACNPPDKRRLHHLSPRIIGLWSLHFPGRPNAPTLSHMHCPSTCASAITLPRKSSLHGLLIRSRLPPPHPPPLLPP